ncbi:MAG: hypothetical protein MRJ65_01540 [Candidatus Brocadiaceae bacterium]|nr:hypothetical protein [Candidatus Brocadiaceae bacterium]
MKNMRKGVLGCLMAIFMAGGTAGAGIITISDDIATSTTWTADNVYRLQDQIYVLPGATLTIEAGTVIASSTGIGGSLAVARGAKIFVNGTKVNPVIMTSTDDVNTWERDSSHPSGGNPKTGTWRAGANEWGNLTIMGRGLISASHFGGLRVGNNTKDPSGLNEKQMEGLTDPLNALYGGSDDNDDSGSISYLSLRYAGKVIGLGNELNGLSLGAIGRETDIDHVEIMNNVDDGVEIWGGTVNLKYISIWNVGDDSFDVDQGWRGKAQFIFIVQGYSIDAKQGSGVGDNCFETDGAEDSDAQPVTTSTIYNATVVGNPGDGDGGTVWRDNARVQYRNCIFMDLGEKLVRPDGDDGDGASGYGFNGTLSFEETWETDYTVTSTVNDCDGCSEGDFNHADTLYTVQTSGKLAEITDSVFFRNLNSGAYTDSDAVGVTINGGSNSGKNNVVIPGSDPKDAPIVSITRGAKFTSTENKDVFPVVSIDPRPANEALVSAGVAPNDGFFTPASYRGAFSPDSNWLDGWTAADAYSMVVASPAQDPVPDIKANNSDGPITVVFNNLTVTVTLDPNALENEGADWWLAAETPLGWYSFDLATQKWVFAGDSQADVGVTLQRGLVGLPVTEVLDVPVSDLPPGSYTFYFGVDLNMNGVLDVGELFADSVKVSVL